MIISNLTPKHNEQVMGCNDTEHVGISKEYRFSRIFDLMIECTKLKIDPEVIWHTLPTDDKMEMNYGKWYYKNKF